MALKNDFTKSGCSKHVDSVTSPHVVIGIESNGNVFTGFMPSPEFSRQVFQKGLAWVGGTSAGPMVALVLSKN